MRGCAINPLIGPASQTKLVAVSVTPSPTRNGVPYLLHQSTKVGSDTYSRMSAYPSSTLHVICAPSMDTLRNTKSQNVSRRGPAFSFFFDWLLGAGLRERLRSVKRTCGTPRLPPAPSSAAPPSSPGLFLLAGHGICVVGSGSACGFAVGAIACVYVVRWGSR